MSQLHKDRLWGTIKDCLNPIEGGNMHRVVARHEHTLDQARLLRRNWFSSAPIHTFFQFNLARRETAADGRVQMPLSNPHHEDLLGQPSIAIIGTFAVNSAHLFAHTAAEGICLTAEVLRFLIEGKAWASTSVFMDTNFFAFHPKYTMDWKDLALYQMFKLAMRRVVQLPARIIVMTAGSNREWLARYLGREAFDEAIDLSGLLGIPSIYATLGGCKRVIIFAPHLSAVSGRQPLATVTGIVESLDAIIRALDALYNGDASILDRPLPNLISSPLWPVLSEQLGQERLNEVVNKYVRAAPAEQHRDLLKLAARRAGPPRTWSVLHIKNMATQADDEVGMEMELANWDWVGSATHVPDDQTDVEMTDVQPSATGLEEGEVSD
ncbi:hypothetical protein OC835_007700 [Tilletia horrida]|nr:hypothetical protein OC835_007700 [Tilletia horrida]